MRLVAIGAALGSGALTGNAMSQAPACVVAQSIVIPPKKRHGVELEAPKHAYKLTDGSIIFIGRLSVDADGSPHAYHPTSSKGLDALANAKSSAGWGGIATRNCHENSIPVIQKAGDPAPGFYVSTTKLIDQRISGCGDQRKYVDSERIPYVALPPAVATITQDRGSLVVARGPKSSVPVLALQADRAPTYGIGEGSIEFTRRLGYLPDPRAGGTEKRQIVYVVMKQKMGFPKSADAVEKEAGPAFAAWGGEGRLQACARTLAGLPQ